MKVLNVRYFKHENGKQPVSDWLDKLPINDQRKIEFEIQKVRFGFTIGKGNFAKITDAKGLWEIKANLSAKRIARVLFCISSDNIVLLHGFIKKSQKPTKRDIAIAINRIKREI